LVARWLAWPLQLGVVFCVVLATAVTAVRLPGTIADLHDAAARNSDLSYADREFAGGNGLVIDQEALYQARALIPPDGSFRVETGDALRNATELTIPYIEGFATYFLMPRHRDDDARWLLCYGCDLSRYGDRARIVWQNDGGISIVRLAA
jgi:hypothetical protein